MKVFHPSARKLEAWLRDGATDDVDAHVEDCDRCANRLEELAAPVPELGPALRQTIPRAVSAKP